LTDAGLIGLLTTLPNDATWPFWGTVYVPTVIEPGSNLPVNKKVWVSGFSLLAGKFYLGWHAMPFTEYSRREALAGMVLSGILP